MKKFATLLLFVLCFCACDKDTETSTSVSSGNKENSIIDGEQEGVSGGIISTVSNGNYVQVYIDADTIITFQNTDVFTPCPCIAVSFEGLEYDYKGAAGAVNYARKVGAEEFMYDGVVGSAPSNYITHEGKVLPVDMVEYAAEVAENYEVFRQYAKQLGDTSFTGSNGVPFGRIVVANKITGIEVICNDDFDEIHKKGSDLSDILTFYGSSPADYVKRGYKWAERNYDLPKGVGYTYELITCNVAKISDEEVEFFDNDLYLHFDQLPDNPGTYIFDVTIKFTDKELKSTVTMQF